MDVRAGDLLGIGAFANHQDLKAILIHGRMAGGRPMGFSDCKVITEVGEHSGTKGLRMREPVRLIILTDAFRAA